MKLNIRFFLLFLGGVLTASDSLGKDGDTFRAETIEGISVLYQIISEDAKTVRVGKEATTIDEPPITVSIDQNASGPLTIPATVNGYRVVELGFGAFYWRGGITEIFLPEGLERFNYCFHQNSSLRRFNIPSTVTSFVSHFDQCSNLESIEIPDCETITDDNEFAGSSFKSVTLPAGITEMKKEAFLYNYVLQGLFMKGTTPPEVPETAFPHTGYSFYDNTYVFVPESSVEAYRKAEVWKNFKNIQAPYAAGYVFKCKDKQGIEFEYKVLSAEDKTVQIGSGSGPAISTDYDGNLNLPTFARGYRVAGIASNAFTACTGITAITATYDYPMEIPSTAFPASLYSSGYLYVPEDLQSRYEACSGWSSFQNINPGQYKSGDYFTAKTVEGVEMMFNVINATKKYVMVFRQEYSSEEDGYIHNVISKDTEGPITIPDYILGYKVIKIGNFAFRDCKKITSVHIPDAVISIGQDAFLSCVNLESVNMPTSLTVLRNGAFYNCPKLSGTIYIPVGVTTIEAETFWGCNSLEDIILPSTLTTIGKGAFSNNHHITQLTLPASVTTLGENAYAYCKNLTTITIPATVTSIGKGVFAGCNALTTLTVADGNPNYDSRNGCNALIHKATNTIIQGTTNTVIPATVTAIGPSAYQGLTGITEVDIPAQILSIGQKAFKGCTNIARVVIHGSPQIDDDAFGSASATCRFFLFAATPPNSDEYAVSWSAQQGTLYVCQGHLSDYQAATGWKNFNAFKEVYPTSVETFSVKTAENIDLTIMILDHFDLKAQVGNGVNAAIATATSGRVTIPSEADGYDIHVIATNAFKDCCELTEVVITSGINSIESKAFSGNGALATVTCQATAAYDIADDAFSEETFKKAALMVNTTLEGYFISAVGWKNFANIGGPGIDLTGVTSFTEATVEGVDVTYTVLDANARTVKVGAENDGLAIYQFTKGSITIPAQVQKCKVVEVGAKAFNSCLMLDAINLPTSIEKIGEKAFYYCSKLTSFTLPKGVASLGKDFLSSRNIETLIVEEGNTYYDSRNNCNAIIETASNTLLLGCKNTKLPDDITAIGDYAFYYSGITTAIIPSRVTTIGDNAFNHCSSLTYAYIPASVKKIGYFAFQAESLTDVEVGAKTPISISTLVFSSTAKNATLHVPAGCKAAYEAAEGWKDFKEIIQGKVFPSTTETFVAKTAEGIDMTFKITDHENRIAQVGDGVNAAISTATQGIITISQFAEAYTVTTIATNAFKDCNQLTQVLIDENIPSIASKAFTGCSSLQSVRCVATAAYDIDADAFDNSTYNTATLFVYESVKDAFSKATGWKHFKNIKALLTTGTTLTEATVEGVSVTYTVLDPLALTVKVGTPDNQIAIDQYTSGTLTIPSEVQGYQVVAIGEEAFNGAYNLTRIVIPDGVTTIGGSAFQSCYDLTSLEFPASIQTIEEYGMWGCSSLVKVRVNSAVPFSFHQNAFNFINNAILYVPLGSKETYERADSWKDFKEIVECTSEDWEIMGLGRFVANTIEGVAVTYTVLDAEAKTVMVGTDSFDAGIDENTIGKVTIPAQVKGCKVVEVARHAFHDCEGLTTVKLPSTITTIGRSAFSFSPITSIDLPESLTTIADEAFSQTKLESVRIPASVTSIGKDVFESCYELTSLSVAEGNTVYDSREDCNAIIETASNTLLKGCKYSIIPEGIVTIGYSAFASIFAPYDIVIPNTVTTIGERAFYFSTDLERITIPAGVTTIGDKAFYYTSKLSLVKMLSSQPVAITEQTFSERANTTLCVPYGSKAAYQGADYWKEFKKIVETGDANGDGAVNISDVVAIVNNIMGNPPADFNEVAADVDGDGEITDTDVEAVVNIILEFSISL